MTRKKYPPVKNLQEQQHKKIVGEIFTTITPKYDFLNHLTSLGFDYWWRKKAVQSMRFGQTNRLLDVATGTADIIIRARKTYPHIKAIGADLVLPMLKRAQSKTSATALCRADALNLPFRDNSFDVTVIAFGMRNITNHKTALKEMKRVTSARGMVIVLEMSLPSAKCLRALLAFYMSRVIPPTARKFSPNPAAYDYLIDSIKNFPQPPSFMKTMRQSGLIRISHKQLFMGICHLYTARIAKSTKSA